MAATAGLLRLTQASSMGGSAETDEIALTVRPKRPPVPSVVTIDTPVAAAPIAEMKFAVVSVR